MAKFEIINEEKTQRAILVGLRTTQTKREFDANMEELSELVKACKIEPVLIETQSAPNPIQATYIGHGKVEEIKEDIKMMEANIVVFDQMLSPMQYRNLGKEFGIEVIDRTGLILRIFSEQAKTREARLQVEHANLQYVLPRLAGMWTHLGRQAGSSGSKSSRGEGEKQIELDRRYIEKRITELEKELKNISKERVTQREKRVSSDLPLVALVGYTNAGKSTTLNRILDFTCDSNQEERKVYEKNKLFATLDTTVRRIEPKGEMPFLLSDTVGFINELPHSLVKAFRSTLEEVKYADLLLEIIDFSDAEFRTKMEVTEKTLREIGAQNVPIIYVYNKADLVKPYPVNNSSISNIEDIDYEYDKYNYSDVKIPYVKGESIYMSSGQSVGIKELLEMIEATLKRNFETVNIKIPYSEGSLLNEFQRKGAVSRADYKDDGVYLEIKCHKKDLSKIEKYIV